MLVGLGSVALALFGAVPATQDAVISNICSSDFFDMKSSAGGYVSFKNDGAVHRPSELYLSGDNIEAIWPLGSPTPFATMTFFEAQLRLPTTTAFPVAVSVHANGKIVWEGRFAEPTNYIIDGGVWDENFRDDLLDDGPKYPFVVIASDKERPIPNIYGLASLTLVAVDAQGKRTRVAVRLPKWPWVARETDQAIRKAKETEVYGECGRPTMPEPVWPVRKPRESGEAGPPGPLPSTPSGPASSSALDCTRNNERMFDGPEPNPFAALSIDEGCDLSDADAAKLELLWPGRHLPPGARNVQMHVLHFQDTSLFVRFDAPLAEARAFANGLVEDLKRGYDPWYGEPPKLSWWPRRWPAGFEGGKDTVVKEDGRPAVEVVLVPKGDTATVWLVTFGD